METSNEWTRVVVLTPPAEHGEGHAISPDLRSLFAARDWFAVQQSDPYLAMAELCLRERAQAARAGWGLHRLERLALVVIRPEAWPELANLVHAVRRYVPAATIWRTANGDVTPIEPGDESPWMKSEPVPRATPPVAAAPAKPHVPQPAAASSPPFARNLEPVLENRPPNSTRITRQEIDMLLQVDEGESRP